VAKVRVFLCKPGFYAPRLGVEAVETGRRRLVTGRINRCVALLARYLPHALASALIGGRSRQFRDAD
jgi:hypothetical protein